VRRTIDFFLQEWLDVEALCAQARFAEHSRETFAAVLDLCERVANERFAPVNRAADIDEPRIEDGRVVLPRGSRDAARAYVETGMLAASQDAALGGMQLPCVVETAANAFFAKAGAVLGGGYVLTVANANLLLAHGSTAQKRVFAKNQLQGRWSGTMCLSEAQAGSSLSDITTRAIADGVSFRDDSLGQRFRIHGSKMWISNGDHELSENIVHLVLAKIPDSAGCLIPGVGGLSLFVVPKLLVHDDGTLSGQRNDVALAGLNHKLGWRGLPNALLSFGEGRFPVDGRDGAVGYLVGSPGKGLHCMFHMMNEARIAVGLGAACLGYAGYESSLAYAKERRQGRSLRFVDKQREVTPVRIIEHPDVRRMLLAQKAYAEGALALELYCARLVDEARGSSCESAQEARGLLELLTPIAKSWPSEWCLEANSLAIQVLGGAGYTRDFPVEQFWRDNRLNMIHEGTHGIQALDLLGRKMRMQGGMPFELLNRRVAQTVRRARALTEFAAMADNLERALHGVASSADAAWQSGDAEEALSNATLFMQAFGHTIIAWLWLDISLAAHCAREQSPRGTDYLRGKLAAARYFFDYELPRTTAWLQVVATRNATCRNMREEWFLE
jgi:butyryl-CoA dehydrogenase